MKYGIYVGVQEGAIRELRTLILQILRSGVQDATMREALRILGTSCKVEGLTVSGCTIIQEAQQLPKRAPGYQWEGD